MFLCVCVCVMIYDFQVVASSDVPLDQLFFAERIDTGFISDEHRKLMDDLNITPVILILVIFSLQPYNFMSHTIF